MPGVTKDEMAAIYSIGDALCAPTLPVTCRICGRDIGTTDNVLHTLDLCVTCKENWKAEMRREQEELKAKLDRAMIRRYNAGVVDMIESLMMFDPIPKARV